VCKLINKKLSNILTVLLLSATFTALIGFSIGRVSSGTTTHESTPSSLAPPPSLTPSTRSSPSPAPTLTSPPTLPPSISKSITLVQGPAGGTAQTANGNLTVVLSQNPTVGNVLILCYQGSCTNGNDPSVSAVNQTNVIWNNALSYDGYGGDCEVWWGVVLANAGTAIIITVSGGTGTQFANFADVCEWSGVSTTNLIDTIAINSGLNSPSGTTGITASTTQAEELCIGVIGSVESFPMMQSNPINGFTLLDGTNPQKLATTSCYLCMGCLYKIASSVGTESSGVTFSGVVNSYTGCIVTFLAAHLSASRLPSSGVLIASNLNADNRMSPCGENGGLCDYGGLGQEFNASASSNLNAITLSVAAVGLNYSMTPSPKAGYVFCQLFEYDPTSYLGSYIATSIPISLNTLLVYNFTSESGLIPVNFTFTGAPLVSKTQHYVFVVETTGVGTCVVGTSNPCVTPASIPYLEFSDNATGDWVTSTVGGPYGALQNQVYGNTAPTHTGSPSEGTDPINTKNATLITHIPAFINAQIIVVWTIPTSPNLHKTILSFPDASFPRRLIF